MWLMYSLPLSAWKPRIWNGKPFLVEPEGPLQQHAGGRAGQRAVQGVHLGQQPHVGLGVAAPEAGRRGGVTLDPLSLVPELLHQAGHLLARIPGGAHQVAPDQPLVGAPQPGVPEAGQHAGDEAVADRVIGLWGKHHPGGAGKEGLDLLQGRELRVVPMDHHGLMIGP